MNASFDPLYFAFLPQNFLILLTNKDVKIAFLCGTMVCLKIRFFKEQKLYKGEGELL